MLHSNAHLNSELFDSDKLEHEPTRNGFGRGLVRAGEMNHDVVAICADLAESTRMHWFQKQFPDRYIEVGVAEQNLATVGAGMAAAGKVPFISSYAAFSPGRNNEQIRTTISLNESNVKVVGSHAGVSVGPDGATHQALEDIGLMRMQPHMTVIAPVDANQAQQATIVAAEYEGPVYLRLARAKSPVFTTDKTPFEIGNAYVYFETPEPEVTVIVTGNLAHNALVAAKGLEGVIDVDVIALPTIKPLDRETILKSVKKSGAVVTVEEHQIHGGMGSAIAEFLVSEFPVPQEFVGVHDRFGQSGTPEELIQEYGMDVKSIASAVKKVIKRK